MQISSRFTIAVHMLACIDTFKDKEKINSSFLAKSVNVNPVIIRQILLMLKKDGIVYTKRGSSKIEIIKPTEEITLLDIFKAVEALDDDRLFGFHENPSTQCPVGRNIHNVLDDKLDYVQNTLEKSLSRITLDKVFEDTKKYIEKM